MKNKPINDSKANQYINPYRVYELEGELKKKIEGEIRFDNGSRALYATDGSNYRQVPIGVVIPKSINDVIVTVKLCQQFNMPMLSRGGGTSLAGQCCNVAVVMDFSKYLNKVLNIDPLKKMATVQPGCVLDNLREAAEQYHLTFGPDPSTHTHNTLGGMIGNNSCGTHSLLAAWDGNGYRTSDNVESLEILTYDGLRMHVGKTSEEELNAIIQQGDRRGEIYFKLKELRDRYQNLIREKYPQIPRRVSGYNLDELLPEKGFNVARALVGSEGTCVTILEATLNLVHSPPARSLVVFGYSDICDAGTHLTEILKYKPSALEGLDNLLIEFMTKKGMHTEDLNLLPEGKGWLLIEMSGENKQEADEHAQELMKKIKKSKDVPSMKLYDNVEDVKKIWKIRESGLGATAYVPNQPDTWPGWEDSAVPVEKVSEYLRDLKKLFKQYDYKVSVYGHLGQGCIHCRIPFDLKTHAGIHKYRAFVDEAADLVVKLGGSLSGEHGDGQCRAELLPKMFGKELVEAFNQFKSIWDPEWKMNPGKIVDPNPIVSNLRLGTDYNPWSPTTKFKFPHDQNNFARAAMRCVGVGNCRQEKGGVMCPSYQATKEEMHSTRGRSRLLFEMLEQKVIGKKGWHEKAVKQALDLCLSCKGCKKDCPLNVDMAKYKAEFLFHYFEHRLRHRSAYAFGFIHRWLRLASLWPGLFNYFNRSVVFSPLVKFAAGIEKNRKLPVLAKQTFQEWYQQNRKKTETKNQNDKPKIILWSDTFTNYFNPEIAISAVEILEEFGFNVMISPSRLCCGRPLYDFGFLTQAQKFLKNIIEALRDDIRQGTYIVGLEPSCVATFRDELIDMFPHDEDAQRMSKQTFILSEFIMKKVDESKLPKFHGKVLVQPHCHHHAVLSVEDEKKVLEKLGLETEILNAGCCGMAGSFGYEKGERYQVSMKIAENFLFPAIRKTSEDTLIMANGFSCRTQINEGTSRKALHLAEVIKIAFSRERYSNL